MNEVVAIALTGALLLGALALIKAVEQSAASGPPSRLSAEISAESRQSSCERSPSRPFWSAPSLVAALAGPTVRGAGSACHRPWH